MFKGSNEATYPTWEEHGIREMTRRQVTRQVSMRTLDLVMEWESGRVDWQRVTGSSLSFHRARLGALNRFGEAGRTKTEGRHQFEKSQQ